MTHHHEKNIEVLTYVYEIWGLHVPFWNALLNPSMDSYPINFWNQTHIWPNLQLNSLKKKDWNTVEWIFSTFVEKILDGEKLKKIWALESQKWITYDLIPFWIFFFL